MIEPIILNYDEPSIDKTRGETRIEDLWGNFPQVTTTPTWTPQTFRDSIAVNTSTAKLYYYDFTNNAWKSISSASTSYGGKVTAAATGNTLPSGWSASVSGANVYTITHNLASVAYAVCFSVASPTVKDVLQSKNANTFTVDFENSAGTAFATAFDFILIPIT